MSVEIKRLKHEFLREALQKGWDRPPVDTGWLERAGRDRMDRWFRGLYALSEEPPLPRDRFLNHFSIGADPEFIFMAGGARQDARTLGLKAGLAFGADNNGRLVELRPAPSQSALSVLTSMWLTMHWLAAYVPDTPNYIWRAGAYVEADGLGGHLHFGRHREHLREREVRALDRITHLLYTAGCYSREEGRLRYRQAQGGRYGGQSDTRPQPWGWEYRTFPSWLDTPWLAYLSMVLGKLAVVSDLTPVLTEEDGRLTADQARGQIRLTLAFFKSLDDDARLALNILARRGFPQHINGGDLKINWGIFNGPLMHQKVRLPAVWPQCVPSVPALEQELGLAMLEGRLPEAGALQPTWVPNELPAGYVQLIHVLPDTRLLPGLGEWCVDVCYHKTLPVNVHHMTEGNRNFRFPAAWRNPITRKNLVEKLARLGINYDYTDIGEREIMIGASHGNIRAMLEVRDLLIKHGLLPIWSLSEVREDSYKDWHKAIVPKGSKALGPETKGPEAPPPPVEVPLDLPNPNWIDPNVVAGGPAVQDNRVFAQPPVVVDEGPVIRAEAGQGFGQAGFQVRFVDGRGNFVVDNGEVAVGLAQHPAAVHRDRNRAQVRPQAQPAAPPAERLAEQWPWEADPEDFREP